MRNRDGCFFILVTAFIEPGIILRKGITGIFYRNGIIFIFGVRIVEILWMTTILIIRNFYLLSSRFIILVLMNFRYFWLFGSIIASFYHFYVLNSSFSITFAY